METAKTFIQVFIKSAEDLPKEAGKYWCYSKRHDVLTLMKLFNIRLYWLDIDWYLKPVAEFRPVGREEINWKQIHDDFIAWDIEGKFEFSQKQIFEWFKKRIATELSEVKESGQSNVTDEQIEKWACEQSVGDEAFNDGCKHGAKSALSGQIVEWIKNNK